MGWNHRLAAFGGAALLVVLAAACQAPSPWHAQRVNVDSAGNQANGYTSPKPVASPDGSKVAFSSRATNLVADSEGDGVFVRDLATGTTTRAGNRPAVGLTFSPDGSKLLQFAYAPEDLSGVVDMVLTGLATGTSTTLVANVNNSIYPQHPLYPGPSQASFSPDGSKIVFDGWAQATGGPTEGATCLLPLPHSPPLFYNCFDVYVYDLGSGHITLVSHSADGSASNNTSARPSFSPDGSKVLYFSQSGGQVPTGTASGYVYIRDLATDALTTVDVNGGASPNGSATTVPQFSPDGTHVAFTSSASNLGPTDTNGTTDVYVRNLGSGTPFTLVSANAAGTDSGNNVSSVGTFSPDGSLVTFTSYASNLGPADTNGRQDIFVRPVAGGAATLVSTNGDCTDGGENDSFLPVFSPDGRRVLFTTSAGNLGPKDSNQATDLYTHELATCTNNLVSPRADGADSGNNATDVFGRFAGASKVLFLGYATDLVPGDTNDQPDVFVATLRGADLAITGSGFWRDGAETYNLRVTNAGPDAAAGVKVSATLPQGANSIGGPGSCTVKDHVLTCTVGDLAAGDSRDVPLGFALQDPQPDFGVTAAVSATPVDPDGANNAVSFTVTTSG